MIHMCSVINDLSCYTAVQSHCFQNMGQEGERPQDSIISDGGFGYNISAMHPVVKNGKTVAMVGVEIPMVTLKNDLFMFLRNVMIGTLLAIVIAILLAGMYFMRTIISPIKMVSSEAKSEAS